MNQRITEYLKFKGISKLDFANTIGVSHSYLTSMRKGMPTSKLALVQSNFTDLNIEWLVTGLCNMLNTPQHMSVTNYGTNSGTMGNNVCVHTGSPCPSADDAEVMTVEKLPIIPSNIVNEPKIDVLKYITTHKDK